MMRRNRLKRLPSNLERDLPPWTSWSMRNPIHPYSPAALIASPFSDKDFSMIHHIFMFYLIFSPKPGGKCEGKSSSLRGQPTPRLHHFIPYRGRLARLPHRRHLSRRVAASSPKGLGMVIMWRIWSKIHFFLSFW